jgi:septal ring factor EnvC (AmiA/AmiB activator)
MEGGIQTAPMEKWANIVKTMEVHPCQVGEHVKTGWVILMAYMRRIDIPDQQFQNNCCMQTTKQVYEPVVVMGQTNLESMMQELNDAKAELNRLRPRVPELATECEKLKHENTALTHEAKVLAESKTELFKDLGTARDRYGLLDTAKTKLEGDIAKIRRALGEIRMKEILGEGVVATTS